MAYSKYPTILGQPPNYTLHEGSVWKFRVGMVKWLTSRAGREHGRIDSDMPLHNSRERTLLFLGRRAEMLFHEKLVDGSSG